MNSDKLRNEKHYHGFGTSECAKCGRFFDLIIDHFISKSCKMNINETGNYVGICECCNKMNADRIVIPDWYFYLEPKEKRY